MSFNNKVVIVTGGSAGIGAATAEVFVKEGADVVIVGRDETKLKEVSEKCALEGKLPMIIKADVSQDEDVRKIVTETINKYGKIDILVNNAAILHLVGILDDKYMEIHDKIMNINFRAVVHLSKLALPHLIESKGNIVNVSSVASMDALPPNLSSYRVSKAALDKFTQSLAVEAACKGVRVNSVNPGPVRTNIFETGGTGMDVENLATFAALKRISEPVEVADFIAFIASEKAIGVTGSIFVIDNGFLLK